MKRKKKKAAEWCHCVECRQCDLCWPSMKSQFYPGKLQLKFCQSSMWIAEQREAFGAVWIFAVPAPGFAGECSESSGLCCDKKGGHKWLRREWQACPSQEVEQGEVERDTDSSGVSSTDSWTEGSRIKIFNTVEWGKRGKYCSVSSSATCGKKYDERRDNSSH